MLSLRPHSYINTASVLQSTMKANMTQSLKPHVSHKYISVHPSLTTMWYYNDTICTVLPDWLFSQLNHTATLFCLHFPVVTITSQIADWATLKKWNEKSRRTHEKISEMSLIVEIFCVLACIKFDDRIWRWRRCVEAGFESLDAGTEEWISLHGRNIFEGLRDRSNAPCMDHHSWWVVGFWIWFIHKASASAVEEEQQTTVQKSSHGSVPAEIDVNFIFRRPRWGDGGTGAILGKCRRCFLYRNALRIENFKFLTFPNFPNW